MMELTLRSRLLATRTSMDRVNYYNYFTEVEEHFVKRRSKNLLISPLDWSLIETWKQAGIPLHIVLRGIDRTFDAYDARSDKTKIINSIFYCHQEVLLAFEEYKQLHVGVDPEAMADAGDAVTGPEQDKEKISGFLHEKAKELTEASNQAQKESQTDLAAVLSRALARLEEIASEIETQQQPIEYENLERDLASIDKLILDAAEKQVSEDELKMWNTEAKKELKHYKKNLAKETYDKILENYIHKKMRQRFGLPALTLFHI